MANFGLNFIGRQQHCGEVIHTNQSTGGKLKGAFRRWYMSHLKSLDHGILFSLQLFVCHVTVSEMSAFKDKKKGIHKTCFLQ